MSKTRRDGVRRAEGVIGTADVALLSFSIVGHAVGEGMMRDGKRTRRFGPATFLTDAEACRGTSASSSVTSYSESKSLSARLMRLTFGYEVELGGIGKRGDGCGVISNRRALGVGKSSSLRGDMALSAVK